MNPQHISGETTNACEGHGSELLVRPASDGSATQIAFCRFCRRYYGRVMNSPQTQAQGFRPAQHQARKERERA